MRSARRRQYAFVALLLVALPAFAATITVNNASGISVPGHCTLFDAIRAANANAPFNGCPAGTPGLDTIAFNIGGGGVQVINAPNGFNDISEPVIIDGTTQPGFAGTPLITLNGTDIVGVVALRLLPTAGGSTIRSLAIGNYYQAIDITGSNNHIAGNHIGLDAAGTSPAPNRLGIMIVGAGGTAMNNLIGGAAPADRNLVANNVSGGINIAFSDQNIVRGNVVGMDINGDPMGNGGGISLQDANGNLIENNNASNNVGGISVGNDSSNNTVRANIVNNNSNGGITVFNSSNNIIGAAVSGTTADGNTVAFNSHWGVRVGGVGADVGSGNSILTNSIHGTTGLGNTGLGIELDPPFGHNGNDNCDADTGANELQNSPTLFTATTTPTSTTIRGQLNSVPNQTYTIEFFSDTALPAEGQTHLGSTTVTTDASCVASFTATVPVALTPGTHYVTATATRNANTSEFSSDVVPATTELAVMKSFTPATVVRNSETSQITVTIQNLNQSSAVTNLIVTDAYHPSFEIDNAGPSSTTCGGTLTANPGQFGFQLIGGTIAAGGTCVITTTVIGSFPGSYTNTIQPGMASGTNAVNVTPASATLTVTQLAAPIVTKSFTAPAADRTAVLTITLQNPNATAITGVAFTDNYPDGLVNATPPNAATSCGGTVTAAAGGTSLALSGGVIPPSGSCTVSVTVRGAGGELTNTIPAGGVTSANAAPSAAAASATLNAARADVPTLSTWMLLAFGALLALAALLRLS